MTPPVTARAHANIALVKYWGKANTADNIPAAGSLSFTLDAFHTTTTVDFDPEYTEDAVELNGQTASQTTHTRVSNFLERVRKRAHIATYARAVSHNNFPTASGLASSAAAFAALAVAACHAAELTLTPHELSALARQGSGSAARSIYGGFARMWGPNEHTRADKLEAIGPYATQLATPSNWQPAMVIAIVDGGVKKTHSSTDAMEHTRQTSPLYPAWLTTVADDLREAEATIAAGDFKALGTLAEANCLAMHATALAARPAIQYWRPTTLAIMDTVRTLRKDGVPAYFTIDAGPHVKVFTERDQTEEIEKALRKIEGVTDVIVTGPGPAAHLVREPRQT